MRIMNKEAHAKRKIEIMETCFDCYAEHGFGTTGIKKLAAACGFTSGSLYSYFENLDDLVIQATEHCMSKVEDDFMAKAPKKPEDLMRFIDDLPYWTAKKHGKKYRLMYQIYTHPKYIESGKKFFDGVNKRYSEYAASLQEQVGLPTDVVTPLIFTLIRACVHYALFEDEFYLQAQIGILKKSILLLQEKYQETRNA